MKLIAVLVSLVILVVSRTAMAEEFTRNPDLFDYVAAENRDLGEHSPGWRDYDKGLEVAYQLLNLADWTQTRQIARQPLQYFEKDSNRLVGSHPSRRAVNIWHLIKAIGQPLIANQLNQSWRSTFNTISVGMTANAVNNNRSIGLDIIRW